MSTKNDNPQRWEDITKAKVGEYLQQSDVTDAIKESKSKFQLSKDINLLSRIYKVNTIRTERNQPLIPHDNIFRLVYSKDMLRIAFRKLSKNKGAMTPGSENSTASDINENTISKIHDLLKSNQFHWSRVRRIMIPKPGKAEKRPLGLPDFSNKMVQETIRMVLEAIYEPTFKKYETNFGFRPNRSCDNAIEKIKQEFKSADWFIEGDIKGAYDNVDHDILINSLKKRIKDKKFLKLIHSGLKSGILDMNIPKDTLLGIPQGGIASPILFNIYMHELDEYVINHLKPKYEKTPIQDKVNPLYETIHSQITRTRKKIKEISEEKNIDPRNIMLRDLYEIIKNNPQTFKTIIKSKNLLKLEDIYETEDEKNYRKIITEYQKNRNTVNNTTTKKLEEYSMTEQLYIKKANVFSTQKNRIKKWILQEIQTNKIDISEYLIKQKNKDLSKTKNTQINTSYLKTKAVNVQYIRYADDWITAVRGEKEIANNIMRDIDDFLKNNLKLQLSKEKTKITNVRLDKALFLGFQIFHQRFPLIRKRENTFIQRYSALQVHPDTERLIKRFTLKGIIKDNKPREIGFLTILKDHEIIEKYNQIMLGLGNYYIRQISYPSRLNRWHYLLYYSCLKTLATKHKTTTKQIINKYGYKDISFSFENHKERTLATNHRIIAKYKLDDEIKYKVLLNYKEFMSTIYQLKQDPPPQKDIDFLTLHKVNFRTAFKLTTMCGICGSNYKLQNHHIKPIRLGLSQDKQKRYKGFDKLVAALGRKQITVCGHCHNKIHNGTYNGLSLNHFYDLRLTVPESYIKIDLPNPNKSNPSGTYDEKENKIYINEIDRTYFNPNLQKFYLNKA